MEMLETGLVAAAFCAVHLAAGRLYLIQTKFLRAWLSSAAGISVAYVFVDILPELSSHHQRFIETAAEGIIPAEQRIYVAALVGFVFFFGLQKFLLASEREHTEAQKSRLRDAGFWVEVAGYALYSVLVGYLLEERAENGTVSLAMYAVAMSLHLAVADHNLMRDFGRRYQRTGSWITTASILAGWLASTATTIPATITAWFFAFIAGGVVMTSMNEELARNERGQFWWFLAGAAGCAALLMV